MTQRPNSSWVPNKHLKNPSLIRFPLPFTGNRVGAPSPPPSFPPLSQPVEEGNGAGYSPSLPPSSPFTMYQYSTVVAGGGENLPPRKSHRRSNSDVTFAMMPHSHIPSQSSLEGSVSGSDWFNLVKEGPGQSESDSMEDILRDCINLDNIDHVLNSLGKTEMDAERTRNSTESEGERSDNVNGLKRRAGGGDIAPTSRHYRSVSMDSCFIPKFNSGEGNSNAAYIVEFGNTKFTAAEMKKISADKKLAAIVTFDPKQVKRMLANRKSAARSKEKQTQYMAKLEHNEKTLRNEITLLSAQLTHLQRNLMGLTNENSELKFRLQAMEQQAQLRDALYERLTEDFQRLGLVEIGEPSRIESKTSLNPEMFQQQLSISQLQQQQQSNQNSTMEAYHASNQ